jgi:putative oxidoreductase
VFITFGLNGFLHFIPQPPPPPGLVRDYFVLMTTSHYIVLPFLLQLVTGLLFLVNRFVPLALVLIAPVIVNILMFHVLMAPEGIAPGIVVTILWLVVAYSVRSAFSSLFRQHGEQI